MQEETVMSLKWQSFSSHLAVSLDTCYEKQQFVDLSLVCKDGTILKCHKMVLANSSSFFRRLLMANDHPHPMIILHDIEADELKTLVNFMYCGEIQVVQSEVRRLLKLAEILEVTGLRHIHTSVLIGDTNNTVNEARKPTNTPRSRNEEPKNLPAKTSELELNIKSHVKSNAQSTSKLVSPSHVPKIINKNIQDNAKKNDLNINNLGRLETGQSGISIVDINDMPSTSRGLPNVMTRKRKETHDAAISWPKILSAISKDQPYLFKKLCVMDEVEITASKPAQLLEQEQNKPLDRRKLKSILPNVETMNCPVFIKDEVDITNEMEEDNDMDPLEFEDIDSDNPENTIMSSHIYPHSHNP